MLTDAAASTALLADAVAGPMLTEAAPPTVLALAALAPMLAAPVGPGLGDSTFFITGLLRTVWRFLDDFDNICVPRFHFGCWAADSAPRTLDGHRFPAYLQRVTDLCALTGVSTAAV